MIYGYIRVSTKQQDIETQKRVIFEYAFSKKIIVDEFIEIEISSKKSLYERRIEELLSKLKKGDTLLCTEISRLGRKMLEVLNVIKMIDNIGVSIIFIKQPELSVTNAQRDLLLAISGYYAQTEQEFISMRVKMGLEKAKSKGVKIGRRKGSKNINPFDLHKDKIIELIRKGLDIKSIFKVLNKKDSTYTQLRYYIKNNLGYKRKNSVWMK